MLEEYIDRDGCVGVNQTDSNMASLRHCLFLKLLQDLIFVSSLKTFGSIKLKMMQFILSHLSCLGIQKNNFEETFRQTSCWAILE